MDNYQSPNPEFNQATNDYNGPGHNTPQNRPVGDHQEPEEKVPNESSPLDPYEDEESKRATAGLPPTDADETETEKPLTEEQQKLD